MNKITFFFFSFISLSVFAGTYCDMPPYPYGGGVTAALERSLGKSCEHITAEDLLTVTELTIQNAPFPGNLRGLNNLKTLLIESYFVKPLNFSAGIFSDAPNLESIGINATHTQRIGIGKGTFSELLRLKEIIIFAPARDTIEQGIIASGAFNKLPSLEIIDFQTYCSDTFSWKNYKWNVAEGAFSSIEPHKIQINQNCVKSFKD